MSRLKGLTAAGQKVLTKIKPATPIRQVHAYRFFMASSLLVVIGINSLVGMSGSSIPVPPRKPDTAALMLEGVSLAAYNPAEKSNPGLEEQPYRSPFQGDQMDLYRDIFRLQAAGDMEGANAVIARLKDGSLMGHVLAQRYLHASYKASFNELKEWLARYADLPQAQKIAKLANARVPSGHNGSLTKAAYSAASIEAMEEQGMEGKAYSSKIRRTSEQNSMASDMIRQIRRQIQQYEPSAALNLFNQSNATIYLDSIEKDRVLAMIASGYLYAGKTDDAERISAQALNASRGNAPLAGWVHGLSKWRQGLYAQAASSFEVAAGSPYSSGWMVSAAAYWAYRAYDKTDNDRRARHWLSVAADYPRTFYGLLALQALGKDVDLNWDKPHLTGAQEKAILKTAAGQRAEKLLAAGEVTLAEAEIRSLYVRGNKDSKKALLAYAYDRRLPSLSMKLGYAASVNSEDSYDAALYPAMPWSPNRGYRIDRALLHAIIRQESKFDALAENKGSGATGLMQLMPRTANYLGDTDIFHAREGKNLLKTPEVSLDLGQKYVEELLNNPLVGQDLISLAIAYNAGPGRLAKWKSERSDIDDPLLFVETIPFAETRAYVERVLSNYWIYRMKFDQPNDSMQAMVEGRWARYAAHDKGAVKFAAAD